MNSIRAGLFAILLAATGGCLAICGAVDSVLYANGSGTGP